MIISLIGFMGCGKSSVGRELSRLLCCPFMDLDDLIVQREGRAIPEIFSTDGEGAFRRMEHEALRRVVALPVDSVGPRLRYASAPPGRGWQNANSVHQEDAPFLSNDDIQSSSCNSQQEIAVLALGGGTVMTEECREIVKEKTVCVYMKATVETLMEHLEGQTEGRPMLSGGSGSGRQNGAENSALRSRIEGLMEQRAAVYEDTAHHIIVTDGMSVEHVCSKIREKLEI